MLGADMAGGSGARALGFRQDRCDGVHWATDRRPSQVTRTHSGSRDPLPYLTKIGRCRKLGAPSRPLARQQLKVRGRPAAQYRYLEEETFAQERLLAEPDFS